MRQQSNATKTPDKDNPIPLGDRYQRLLQFQRTYLTATPAQRNTEKAGEAVTLLQWCFANEPVALLGCFSKPEGDYVLQLKPGINRIGEHWGDHKLASEVRLMEERQWILIIGRDGQTFLGGDRSSSFSYRLPANSRSLVEPAELAALRLSQDSVAIDRSGDVLCPMQDGDVLINWYGAFVFTILPQTSFLDGSAEREGQVVGGAAGRK
ncbi:MAG: hypothetical protein IPK82_00605 [Polyangiaceae bacterium]|nr:hypothetical protein [Polyangiaceae bacterium]